MKTYKIIINGQEVGTQELTPEDIKRYNAAGIIVKKA